MRLSRSYYKIMEQRQGMILSILLHLLVIGGAFLYFRTPLSTMIVAAGEGNGETAGAIEVGLVDAGQFGLSMPRSVSLPGDDPNTPNNEIVETDLARPQDDAELLPSTTRQRVTEQPDRRTDRPTARQSEQFVTATPQRGGSADRNVEIGRSSGSQIPSLVGGVGMGNGSGVGGSGLPGGSEYGRRIQSILSRNYNPPAVSTTTTEYVIVRLRIARDGRILSLTNGRLNPTYLKRRSAIDLVNYAAERAVIASNPLPPFPNGFLMESQEATAEIWFRYPK
ncbi:MAG: TonB C-terminal domain-containing protein [Acidobacteriota bacterium]